MKKSWRDSKNEESKVQAIHKFLSHEEKNAPKFDFDDDYPSDSSSADKVEIKYEEEEKGGINLSLPFPDKDTTGSYLSLHPSSFADCTIDSILLSKDLSRSKKKAIHGKNSKTYFVNPRGKKTIFAFKKYEKARIGEHEWEFYRQIEDSKHCSQFFPEKKSSSRDSRDFLITTFHGRNLRDFCCKQRGKNNISGISQIMKGCVECVDFMHRNSFSHGNIHFTNFVYDGTNVRIIDFAKWKKVTQESLESQFELQNDIQALVFVFFQLLVVNSEEKARDIEDFLKTKSRIQYELSVVKDREVKNAEVSKKVLFKKQHKNLEFIILSILYSETHSKITAKQLLNALDSFQDQNLTKRALNI
jgi:hypothetical protein